MKNNDRQETKKRRTALLKFLFENEETTMSKLMGLGASSRELMGLGSNWIELNYDLQTLRKSGDIRFQCGFWVVVGETADGDSNAAL